MENLLNPYDKEYMRLAILKHEETFKHQVHELHRLYRIQKLLMRNIAKERPNPSQLKTTTTQDKNINYADKKLDLEIRPGEDDDEDQAGEDHEIEIELTLGPSNYRKIRKNIITPLTSDHSGATFSSSNSTGSSSHNRSTSCLLNHGRLITKSEDDELDYHNNDKKLRQPPWLFQVLSLNMTTN